MIPVLLAAALLTNQPASLHATTTASVPFYSQFKDISSTKWQKVGCGIASLAMVLDYYSTSTPSVNTLLTQAVNAGAYSKDGWTYAGLISLAKRYGMSGESKILYNLSDEKALAALEADLDAGPLIASVHYKFDPKNPIPHLVVVTGIKGNEVYYNDPAASGGNKKIPVAAFLKSWKKRYILIQPPAQSRLS